MSESSAPSPLDYLPARWPPLLYLGFAHLSLATAFGLLAVVPRELAGFFYHPRMLAVVHLVSLGWISASILGAIYLVGPLALRMPLPARRLDYAAFVAYAVGVSGMVSHFWLDRPAGMAWAAGLVVVAMAHVALRVLLGLGAAKVPGSVKRPVGLAFANVLLAGVLGVLLGVNKLQPFLPASQLASVLGHAHLAALGWGTLMVVGAGYRMLPMMLPAAMPQGPWVDASVALIQVGGLGLAAAFLAGGRFVGVAALLSVAGIGAFLARVVWMLRHRRPAPKELRRPDWSMGHALQALVYLVLASAAGLALAFLPASEGTLRLAMAYGVFGLVGFLAQIVVGVEGRILPLYAWLWGFSDREHRESPPSLHAVAERPLQALGLALWTLGVPLLAAGLAFDRVALVSAGSAGLCLAVLTGAVNLLVVLRRLWAR